MSGTLHGTVVLVTGASSGIGAATAARLAEEGASVVVLGRRRDRLDAVVQSIVAAGGQAFAVPADITSQTEAATAVQAVVDRYGRLDVLINNAGLMLLGSVADAELEDWERMLAINVQGLLYITKAALPHLLAAPETGSRGVADIVNIGSVAGRMASPQFAVYNLTKFGVAGFTEALRQETTQKNLRVGLVEPGAVDTELGSHNSAQIQGEMLDPFNAEHERLRPEDIAEAVAFMVTRPRRTSIADILVMPTDQAR